MNDGGMVEDDGIDVKKSALVAFDQNNTGFHFTSRPPLPIKLLTLSRDGG